MGHFFKNFKRFWIAGTSEREREREGERERERERERDAYYGVRGYVSTLFGHRERELVSFN